MGVVTAYRKRHWTGLDADLASVPNPQLGDTYLATDKNKLYYKTAAGWKTGLGYEYVPREVPALDFTQANFTLNDAWHVNGLDLSAIVPAGVQAVHLKIGIDNDVAATYFLLRANATTKLFNNAQLTVQVANISPGPIETILYVDADRLVDYRASVGLDGIVVNVLGWFI